MASLFRPNIYKKNPETGKNECIGKGNWTIKWTENGTERRLSTGCRSKGDANTFFREWDGKGKNKHSIEKAETLIMEELDANDYAKSTKELYQTVFNDLKTLFPNKPINCFELANINKYKNHRKTTNRNESVNIYLRTLRTIFNKAKAHKLLMKSEIPDIELLPVSDDNFNIVTNTYEPIQKTYTIENFLKLLSFIHNNGQHMKNKTNQNIKGSVYFNDHATQIKLLEFCLIDFYTGCRRNEVLNMRLSHIDRVKMIIPVVQYKKRGKRRMKNVPIHPYLWEKVISKRFIEGFNPDEKLIDLNPNYVTDKIKKCNRALGFPESLKLHSIRHTYGTELMRLKADRYNIKDLLGHSAVSTSEIYVHTDNETLSSINSMLPVLEYQKLIN